LIVNYKGTKNIPFPQFFYAFLMPNSRL